MEAVINEARMMSTVKSTIGERAMRHYKNSVAVDPWHEISQSDKRKIRSSANKSLKRFVDKNLRFENDNERIAFVDIIRGLVNSKMKNSKATLDQSGIKFDNIGELSDAVLRKAIERDDHQANAQKIYDDAMAMGQTELSDMQMKTIEHELEEEMKSEIARLDALKDIKKSISDNEQKAADKGILSEYLYYYGRPSV